MRAVACVLVVTSLACGDNLEHEESFDAVSGERIKLERYVYQDGANQRGTDAFYDAWLHTRCSAQRWIDDALRCVPIADDAVYADATCTTVVGRARTIEEPKYFLGYDDSPQGLRPARLYRAGMPRDPLAQHYEMRDGACQGPLFEPGDTTYYDTQAESTGLVELVDAEVGTARLGMTIYTTADGLVAPIALRDRELGVACRPADSDDPSVACEPTESTLATYFVDSDCSVPAVAVLDASTSSIARLLDPEGCASYYALGAQLTSPVYRRDGGACARVTTSQALFALGPRIELAAVARTVETVPGRRLQRVVIGDDGLLVIYDRLIDTATRTECRPYSRDGITHCVPAALAAAKAVYLAGCVAPVRIAELPDRVCQRVAFAAATTEQGLELHAIGSTQPGPFAQRDSVGNCVPYTSTPDTVVHVLGPALPPETFVGGVLAGDR